MRRGEDRGIGKGCFRKKELQMNWSEDKRIAQIQFAVPPAVVGSWRVGPTPLGISLPEVCPSSLWLIQNSAAPGSRPQALGLPSGKITIRISGKPHSFCSHQGELWSWKMRQKSEGVLRVGSKYREQPTQRLQR